MREMVFAVALFSFSAVAVKAADIIASPLTIAGIQEYWKHHSVGSVAEQLAALPLEYHQNAVLVRDSGSLQLSFDAAPRQILFGSDAHLLLGIGSDPGDPLYESIEFAEMNPVRHAYQAGRIHFQPGKAPAIEFSPEICKSCHDDPFIPIWGQYPRWPGVYGTDRQAISPDDYAAFGEFLLNQKVEPHFSHLDLILDPRSFALKNRKYSIPNTVMNNSLGDAVATAAFLRLRESSFYDQGSELLLDHVLHCNDDEIFEVGKKVVAFYRKRTATDPSFLSKYGKLAPLNVADVDRLARYRLLGLDPALELIRRDLTSPPRTQGGWFHGFSTLYELIEYQALSVALESDPRLGKLFLLQKKAIQLQIEKITSSGLARARLAQAEDEKEWYFLERQVYAALGSEKSAHTREACRIIGGGGDDPSL